MIDFSSIQTVQNQFEPEQNHIEPVHSRTVGSGSGSLLLRFHEQVQVRVRGTLPRTGAEPHNGNTTIAVTSYGIFTSTPRYCARRSLIGSTANRTYAESMRLDLVARGLNTPCDALRQVDHEPVSFESIPS
jgi:hypothetical protein